MTLRDLPIGKTATILSVGGEGDHGEICPYGRPYGAAHPQL